MAQRLFGYDEEGEAACAGLARGEGGWREGVVVCEIGVYVEGFVLRRGVLKFGEDDGEERGGVA